MLRDVFECEKSMNSEIDINKLHDFAEKLCEEANEESGVLEVFWNAVADKEELLREFDYYMNNKDFLCELKVSGITVADILVWQIDRFKAAIDEGKFALKYNGPHMVLGAFYTMADCMDNPDKYVIRFQSETGTDYPGKTGCCDKGQ